MLHWTPGRAVAAKVTPIASMLRAGPPCGSRLGASRADHARMLAHAATRRRAAVGEDRAYWKACAPAAVARAAAIRADSRFARLP
jgi:hypothetical protein